MSRDKCVLAYSGGLDTSTIVVWLVEQGYEVHAVLVDVGQDEDLEALRHKAIRLGAVTASVVNAKPQMLQTVVPAAIALGATYEGNYRLGTALARPFIALEQVRAARKLGGATLVHGATGKGNDQIRFEFAYRSLAPQMPVLAPWKVWSLAGREDMIEYLRGRGVHDEFGVTKTYSFDENLWHLSVEGGVLEDAESAFEIETVLGAVTGRFAVGPFGCGSVSPIEIQFERGVPVAIDGAALELGGVISTLNQQFRFAPWAWDLVIENRFTGIKSRGLYINPAAKLLYVAVDGLARACLNKATYDEYAALGRQYGTMIYRGEYFSDQRKLLEGAAGAILPRLSGAVTVHPFPMPYVSRIQSASSLFCKALATFEASEYSHADAKGFIGLSWLTSVGRAFEEEGDAVVVEAVRAARSDVRPLEHEPAGGLVSAAV